MKVKTDAVKAEIKAWPPLKKAIWDVVVAEELNGPAYVNAWDLVDKIHTATLSVSPAGVGVETPPPQTHVGLMEQLREKIGDAYDRGDVSPSALSEWCAMIDRALATTEGSTDE